MGILFNNILFFSGYTYQPFDQLTRNPTYLLDERLYYFLDIVVTAKFYTLFSILFAFGFYLQLNRHTNDIPAFLKTYRRRLFILVIIGILHSLFWSGDILLLYALVGFLLMALRNTKRKNLLRLAIFFLLLSSVFDLVFAPFVQTEGSTHSDLAHTTFPDMSPSEVMRVFQDGTWQDIFLLNIHNLTWKWASYVPSGRIFTVLGTFLLGYFLGTVTFFNEKVKSSRLLVLGLAFGLSTTIIAQQIGGSPYRFPPTSSDTLYKFLWIVGQLSLSLFYMSFIARVFDTTSGRKVLVYLEPVGRTALTNYVCQSIVSVAIFYNFGMNLFGRIGLAQIIMIAVGILLVQVVMSNLWLHYYRYGPLEWAWRSLTYRRRIALTRKI